MERIHQMKVVPDVLPDFHPSLDLRVTYPKVTSKTGSQVAGLKAIYEHVEPGVFLLPEQVCGTVICVYLADNLPDYRAS
jgi:large subunit ribosomal protein L35